MLFAGIAKASAGARFASSFERNIPGTNRDTKMAITTSAPIPIASNTGLASFGSASVSFCRVLLNFSGNAGLPCRRCKG